MQFFRNHAKPICRTAATCLLALSIYIPSAQAGIINTDTLLGTAQNRATVENFLARTEVQQQLTAMGADPAMAGLRAANLTDTEVQAMAERINTMPAGGDAVGAIVFVFLVLLITDIAGVTDVFPFVKK